MNTTNGNNYFEWSRFWLLVRMEWYRSRSGIAMALVIILGLLLTGLFMEIIFEYKNVYDSHPGNYGFLLIAGGFILSSLAFKDLGSDLKKFSYLTLPASTFEKFLSMWLLTSAGWVFIFSLFYMFYALIINSAGHLIYPRVSFPAFNILDEIPLKVILYYMVLQGVFLAGAVYFKGFAFAKTLFTLILGGLFLVLVSYIIMADIINTDQCLEEARIFDTAPVSMLCVFLKYLFWTLFAPVCWLATFFGLKEKEV